MSKQTTWTLVLLATMVGFGAAACQREGADGTTNRPDATMPGQQPAPPATSPGAEQPPAQSPGGGAGESGTGGTNR